MNNMGFEGERRHTALRNNMMREYRMRDNMRQGSMCSSNNECGDQRFCNFDNENNGYCESCSYFNSCEDVGFTNKHGMVSCMETCEYHDKRDDMNDRDFEGERRHTVLRDMNHRDFEGERRHTVLRKTRPYSAEAAV